jgi:hypothetical protein
MDVGVGAGAWFWDDDEDLLNSGGAFIQTDYTRSTFEVIEFWDADTLLDTDRRMVYSTTEGGAKKLQSYGYYPCSRDAPIVNMEMKELILSVCNQGEVGFHPCEVYTRSGRRLDAWNLYPLHKRRCIDHEQSDIRWEGGDAGHNDANIKFAKKVILRTGCLDGLDMARLQEDVTWIVLSDRLKRAIEDVNSKGIRFHNGGGMRFLAGA